MTAATAPVADVWTMSRRQLRRIRRYPSLTVMLVGLPVVFLLLFVFVLGGTLSGGLGGSSYVDYVVPGVLAMTVASVVQGPIISVAQDMSEGIIARFRTMAIFRPSVLAGHVLGGLLQVVLGVVVVLGVSVAIGFRPDAGPADWAGVLGLVIVFGAALTWLAVAMGLAADSVETASNVGLPLTLLPFLGSGFVPTDSMPGSLRVFAEYQPFTPVTETLRGLLLAAPVPTSTWLLALGWCVVIGVGGYLWARRGYERR
ncbi:ABC transporter permease [Actinomycetospora termitidis]|uniref:Transport permease protein n=1 Tax=Actinomycetospora termitidis TaxID=3053470 RepID=A0ABT7M9N5_9PSEU|nr:ABC transporter permease [Actinomycetospora sp. Odt1-22]MDL5157384.1 ABC transporter permease [Actinomycetospora sp. Odt1-22]